MTTDLQLVTEFKPIKSTDGPALAVAGLFNKPVTGKTVMDGKAAFVNAVQNHPGYRAPKPSDAYQMHSEGVSHIRGVIETGRMDRLVRPEEIAYIVR